MEKIELKVVSVTKNNSNHVQLFIDGGDCGYLYLNDDELQALSTVFRYGQAQFGYDYDDPQKGSDLYDKQ